MSSSLIEYLSSQLPDINSYLAPSQTFALNMDDLSSAQQTQLQQIDGVTLSQGSVFFADKIHIPLTKSTFQQAIDIVEGNDNTAYLYCAIATAVVLAGAAYAYYRKKFPKVKDVVVDPAAQNLIQGIDVTDQTNALYAEIVKIRSDMKQQAISVDVGNKMIKELLSQYNELFENMLSELPYDFGAVILQKMKDTNFAKMKLSLSEKAFYNKAKQASQQRSNGMEQGNSPLTKQDFYDAELTAESIFTCLANTKLCDKFYDPDDCLLMKAAHTAFSRMFLKMMHLYGYTKNKFRLFGQEKMWKKIHPTTILGAIQQISEERSRQSNVEVSCEPKSFVTFCDDSRGVEECTSLVRSLLSYSKLCSCDAVDDPNICKAYKHIYDDRDDVMDAMNVVRRKIMFPSVVLTEQINIWIQWHARVCNEISVSKEFLSKKKKDKTAISLSAALDTIPCMENVDIQPIRRIFNEDYTSIDTKLQRLLDQSLRFWTAALPGLKDAISIFEKNRTFGITFKDKKNRATGNDFCEDGQEHSCIYQLRSDISYALLRSKMRLTEWKEMVEGVKVNHPALTSLKQLFEDAEKHFEKLTNEQNRIEDNQQTKSKKIGK